jgi:undecaprenyl-diphosphatase
VAWAGDYSFPSGHAQNSLLGVAVLLLIVLPLLRRRGKVAAWCAAVSVVALTGFDRVALGVHYLSDVLAGWLVALALLAGTTVAFQAHRRGPAAVHGLEPGSSSRLSAPGGHQPAAASARGNIPALARELRSLVLWLLAGPC